MKNKLPISVTFITRNEEARIAGAILSVQSIASEIIVVDSNSSDRTAVIAEHLGAKVFRNAFTGFGQQKNYAHSKASEKWVLNLDADERLSPELEKEIYEFFESGAEAQFAGAYLARKTWYLNRWVMHGGWYPNYLLRFALRERSRWSEPEIHEALSVDGAVTHFKVPFEHFSFPNQRSHILKNVEYAELAERALARQKKRATLFDLLFRPTFKFFDMYVLKVGFLDGMAGLFIAVHSAYALFLRYAYLYEESHGKIS